MNPTKLALLATIVAPCLLAALADLAAGREKWPADKAQAWGRETPWLVGANYTPATAINQLEMWQADTFDPEQIDKELAWAKSLVLCQLRILG